MNEDEAKEIFNYLLKDHNLDKFLEFCTDDIKFILHPKHVAAGEYDRKTIYDLFALILQNLFPTGVKPLMRFIMIKKKKFLLLFQKVIL